MRRALVLIALVAVGLVAAPSASAPAAGPCACRGETEREVTFYLHQDGFKIIFDTTDNDGREEAFLGIQRGNLTARYFTSSVVTADTVKARFGDMGELDYSYAPIAEDSAPGPRKPDTRFEGTFTFTGENDYIRIDLDRVKGFSQVYVPPGARPSSLRQALRGVPYRPPYSPDGATLSVLGGSKRSSRFREVSAYDAGGRGRHRSVISGQLLERRPEGLTVARGAIVHAGANAFRWDLDARTATLRPPGPFTGSARFGGRGDGSGAFTGSLRVPILGGESVELAGPRFHGYLHRGVPVDE